MTGFDKKPIYNLKVVVRETGIKPDTLRAWERRYGLPEPQRTSGGHRLYSEFDVQVIKWLMAQQAEGLSISRAVNLWHSLQADGQEPLADVAELASEQSLSPQSRMALGELRDAWIEACQHFNEALAEQILIQAFAVYPPEMVCLKVLQEGLAKVGNLWYEGQATVQQEHFASALAMRRLHSLLAAAAPPIRQRRIIVGCAPDDDHAFAPLLITLMLRYRGWDVLYLGANVPLARLETTLDETQPDLYIITAQQLFTAATLLEVAQALKSRSNLNIAYGGLIFNTVPEIRQRIPAHFLGETIGDTVQTAVNLMQQQPELPEAIPVSAEYQEAYDHYRYHQAAIEAHLWENLSLINIPEEQMVISNTFLGRDILAALSLGDISFLGPNISWIAQYLEHNQIPADSLNHYLRAYYQAASIEITDGSHPLLEWLEQVVQPAMDK